MEETFLIQGIIIDRESFRERDAKVCVYSPERGRQELVARGTKKITSKLAGHIEPVSRANIMVIRGRQLNYLGSALEEDSYKGIKSDLEKIYFTGIALRVFKDLIREGMPDKNVFILLKKYLDITNKLQPDREKLELLLNFFIFKLLCLLGYKPELYRCVKCRKKIRPGRNYFSLKSGGIICEICQINPGNLTISDNCVKLLRLVIKEDIEKLLNLKVDNKLSFETIKIISSFLQFYKP